MCGRRVLLLMLAGLSVAGSTGVTAARRGTSTRSRAAPGRPGTPTAAQSGKVVAGVLDMIVDHVWEHGDYYFHNGRYTDRIATDRLVMAMDHTFIEPYSTAGWLLENTGKDAEALETYLQATKIAPDRWETWYDVGRFYFERKKYSDAIAAYSRAVQLKGVEGFVWHQLAHSFERSGQLQKALNTWEKARSAAAANGTLEQSEGVIDLNVNRIKLKLKEEAGGGERG